MKRLTPPSRDRAKWITREVGFEERLVGARLRQRSGAVPITLYSLEELLVLLHDPHPLVDLDRLERWLAAPLEDPELAAAVGEIKRLAVSDQQKAAELRDLVAARVLQCKEVS